MWPAEPCRTRTAECRLGARNLPSNPWNRAQSLATRPPNGFRDPSPDRSDPAVACLFGAGDEVDRLAICRLERKWRDQSLAKTRPRLDQGRHAERDAEPLFGGLQHCRHAVEPKVTARGEVLKAGLLEPCRPGARLRRQVNQNLV